MEDCKLGKEYFMLFCVSCCLESLRYFLTSYKVKISFVFSISSVITAISLVIAPLIAERIGNLRTMVFTHVISNVFLILIPFMNSLEWSVNFYF